MTDLVQGLAANQLALIEAAGKSRDQQLAALCYEIAAERGQFARELAELGPKPADNALEPRIVTRMRDLADRLNSALYHDDAYAMSGDLVRGEEALLDQYSLAISYSNDEAADKLRQHFQRIIESRDRLVGIRTQRLPDRLGSTETTSA